MHNPIPIFSRENGDHFSQLSSTRKRRLWSNIGVTVPGISNSSKQIKNFERSYVLGNLADLLVTGTLIL